MFIFVRTAVTAVSFQHSRCSHDPRNDRTWTLVYTSKLKSGFSVFFSIFQVLCLSAVAQSPVQDDAESKARGVVTFRDAISLGPKWTCQSSTLAIGVCSWQLPCFDIASAEARNIHKVIGNCQSLLVCLELRSNAILPKVNKTN